MKKKLIPAIIALFFSINLFSQIPLTVLPSGGNKKASVSERVGLTDITIHYDRPGVKGREGKIWGQLIPAGFTDPGFGSSKAAPWRAGANENTTFEFSTDVKIEGQSLPAGKYGFFIAYDSLQPTLIFSKNSTSWGHFYYNDKEDALRVKVRSVPLDKSVEWLKYEFSDQTTNTAVISLQWEKLKIPFKVEVDYINTQVESFRRELRTDKGFIWESWDQAAQWCLQNNTNLPEALLWTDSSTSTTFGGDQSFQSWSTRAQILAKMGMQDSANHILKRALPYANMGQIHQYGRQLLGQKKAKEALEVFQMNFKKNPNQFTTIMGLVRGYSANGDYKSALKYATMALPMAPNQQNKTNVETMISKLKEGKDVN